MQMPFLFMCIQMGVLSGMQTMPSLIADRNIMKFEVSDRLYSEWAFLISKFILQNIVSQLVNLLFLVIVWAFSNIGYASFLPFWGWQLLIVLVTDSLFNTVAAIAKTGAQAQAMAIPPLMFVLLFNGFFITLAGVQDWMLWAIYVSPMFWGLQEMASLLYSDGTPTTSPDYPRSGQFVIDQCAFAAVCGRLRCMLPRIRPHACSSRPASRRRRIPSPICTDLVLPMAAPPPAHRCSRRHCR